MLSGFHFVILDSNFRHIFDNDHFIKSLEAKFTRSFQAYAKFLQNSLKDEDKVMGRVLICINTVGKFGQKRLLKMNASTCWRMQPPEESDTKVKHRVCIISLSAVFLSC